MVMLMSVYSGCTHSTAADQSAVRTFFEEKRKEYEKHDLDKSECRFIVASLVTSQDVVVLGNPSPTTCGVWSVKKSGSIPLSQYISAVFSGVAESLLGCGCRDSRMETGEVRLSA